MSDCCCARLAGLYLLAGLAYAGTVTVATGIQVPESTSPLPATFDGLTGHLVPDSTVGSDSDGASTVWQVSPTGDLIVYATNPASLFDGVLLAAPFGSYGDDTAMSSLEGVASRGAISAISVPESPFTTRTETPSPSLVGPAHWTSARGATMP